MATIQDTLAKRQTESANQINNLYDQQYNSQAAQLQNAYNRSMSDAQRQQAAIAPQYQQQANQMATAYERNRRNANVTAMATGLGTGNAVQRQTALNNMYQQNYSGLRGNELQAQADAAQNMVNIGADYQAKLSAARAEAENKKAAALIEDTNQQNTWYDTQAKQLAQYGDFSAYEKLYGADAANQMKEVWIVQNPEAALNAGMINKARYKKITGHDAGTK